MSLVYKWYMVNKYVLSKRMDNYYGKRLGKIIANAGGIDKAKMFLAKQIVIMHTLNVNLEREIHNNRNLCFYNMIGAHDKKREIVDQLKLYQHYTNILNKTTV